MRKNQEAIDTVKSSLQTHGPQNTTMLMLHTGLSKGQVQGAMRALTDDGVAESEGATLNRVHRIKGDARGAVTMKPERRKTEGKKKRKASGGRTRTRPARKAEASPAPAVNPLDIAIGDNGRVRLVRNGAAPFELLTPDEHQRLHAFLDRMEPMWSEP